MGASNAPLDDLVEQRLREEVLLLLGALHPITAPAPACGPRRRPIAQALGEAGQGEAEAALWCV